MHTSITLMIKQSNCKQQIFKTHKTALRFVYNTGVKYRKSILFNRKVNEICHYTCFQYRLECNLFQSDNCAVSVYIIPGTSLQFRSIIRKQFISERLSNRSQRNKTYSFSVFNRCHTIFVSQPNAFYATSHHKDDAEASVVDIFSDRHVLCPMARITSTKSPY